MVGRRNDGLMWCGNGSVSISEGRRAEKEKGSRVYLISEVGYREGRARRSPTIQNERKQMHREASTNCLDDNAVHLKIKKRATRPVLSS